MKRIRVLAVCLLCLGMICFAGCGRLPVREVPSDKMTEGADIHMEDGTFTVTPGECVEILNKDLKDAGLPLIPSEFEKADTYVDMTEEGKATADKGEGVKVTTYTYHLDDSTDLMLYTFPGEIDGVPLIELRQTGVGKASSEEELTAKKYYNIVCKDIAPAFNPADLNTACDPNYVKTGDLFFWCYAEKQKDGKEYTYIATANEDLIYYI